MDRRQALRLFAGLGLAGVVTGCGDGNAEDEATGQVSDKTIKIGVLAPLSGDRKTLGDEVVNGLSLFLDFNAKLLGRHPVEVATADEGDNEKSAVAGVEKLLGSGVSAIVGVTNSTLLKAVSDKVEEAKVPLLGTGGTPVSLTGAVYTWSTAYVDDEPGAALGIYMRTQIAAGARIGMIAPATSGRDAVTGFRKAFGDTAPQISGGAVWMPDAWNPSANDLVEAVNAIDQLKPDVLFCHAYGPAAVTLVKQLRASGLNQPIYAPGIFTEGTNIADMETLAEGIHTAHNYASDLDNAINQRFADNYRRRYSAVPTAGAVAGYDAGQVLDRAIGLAGINPTAQAVNLAIGRVGQIDSPRGEWQFNQPRTPQQKWYLREVRRDGAVLANVMISELSTLG